MNQVFIINAALKGVCIFCLLKFLILSDKRLVLPTILTFEYHAGLSLAIHKFSSRILWSLYYTHVHPLRFILLFNLKFRVDNSWGNLKDILFKGRILRLILQLCLFFCCLIILLLSVLKFGLCFWDLDVFLFGWFIIFIMTCTFITWFGENLWVEARKIWGLRLQKNLLIADQSTDALQICQFSLHGLTSLFDSFLDEFGFLKCLLEIPIIKKPSLVIFFREWLHEGANVNK